MVYNLFEQKNGETVSPKIKEAPMEEDTRLAEKINRQLSEFTKRISRGLSKPKRKFVSQMLFGMQVARDVKISEIVRTLDEEIKLIKIENRLSRNLQANDLWQKVSARVLAEGARRVERDTVIAIDLTSIEKVYARKMDYLAQVWDGVKKELVNGYWAIEAVAADINRDWVAPLYGELYSQDADDFKSENELLLRVLNDISSATKKKGIFVLDRGGDRKELINPMLLEDMRFVIRANLKRQIKIKGRRKWVTIREAAERQIDCPHTYKVEIDNQGFKEKRQVSLGCAQAQLAGIDKELIVVVVKGFGKDPMVMFTNLKRNPIIVLEMYLTRWKIEESFRFLKQEYGLEDIRVRNYQSLKNTFALLSAVFYFLSVYLGRKLKLNILLKKIYEKAKRFFQMPVFKQYALADGIFRIFFNTRWKCPWNGKIAQSREKQLLLEFMRL